MKYLMLAYTDKDAWDDVDVTSPEFVATCKFYEDLGKELTETGEMVSTEGLADPSLTRTVRKGAGGPVASDGPYAEVKEVLASFGIVDCASYDRVLEIAGRIADAVGDSIEIRPIMSGPPAADV
ncbi:YciI family protein [Antrihabitans spumae]|jgi:hypothetical protein|uniref:YciI family protein n=1 Tax=Antrihabitans spumae TaxID=3373370 RepID=A0ABW7JXK9_9NOCA